MGRLLPSALFQKDSQSCHQYSYETNAEKQMRNSSYVIPQNASKRRALDWTSEHKKNSLTIHTMHAKCSNTKLKCIFLCYKCHHIKWQNKHCLPLVGETVQSQTHAIGSVSAAVLIWSRSSHTSVCLTADFQFHLLSIRWLWKSEMYKFESTQVLVPVVTSDFTLIIAHFLTHSKWNV